MAISHLQDNHWSFGRATCKIFNSILYAAMFTSVFFLSAISADRYLLTFHPVWSQLHRTPRWASSIILGVWLAAALGMPYVVFRETHDDHKGKVTCQNNYAVSTNWESKTDADITEMDSRSPFQHPLLAGLPSAFLIITFCYERVAKKMKERGLLKSSKPFKVMVTATVSSLCAGCPITYTKAYCSLKKQVSVFPVDCLTRSDNYYLQYCVFSHTLPLYWGELQKSFQEVCPVLFESTFSEDSSAERTENLNSETDM